MLLTLSPLEMAIVEQEIVEISFYLIVCLLFYFLFIKYARKDKAEVMQLNQQQEPSVVIPEQTDNPLLQERLRWSAELAAAKRLKAADREKLSLKEREQLDYDIYVTMLGWGDTEVFFSQVNKRLNGLVDNLRKLYPQLTDTDMQLLLLYVLQIPQDDILTLMNYSVNSLPTIKKRLCNKMNISSSAVLPAEITKILSSM